MNTYHFTDTDYTAIVKAIRKSYKWRDDGIRERLTLELDKPNIIIDITRYVSGVWTVGATFGDEKERTFEVTGEEYEVTSFECFNDANNDIHSDFDRLRLSEALSWPRHKAKAA
jgi:hypothetical protein